MTNWLVRSDTCPPGAKAMDEVLYGVTLEDLAQVYDDLNGADAWDALPPDIREGYIREARLKWDLYESNYRDVFEEIFPTTEEED